MTAMSQDQTKKRPNVLWIMTDQFNANCLGTGDRGVKTPWLDQLAGEGIRFDRAYCNNPICSPSRISFISGQYPHNHGVLGNANFELDDYNPNTVSAVFSRAGYQTGLVGKAHMIKNWDEQGFEYIKYCDLCDADPDDPFSVSYFKYLHQNGLTDEYDLGVHSASHPGGDRTAFISRIPQKHCVETWTGEEGISFLEQQDQDRPFFLQLSFQRPHEPHTVPYDSGLLYDPDEIELPANAKDLFENRFKGHHSAMQQYYSQTHGCPYRPQDEAELKRQLAFYFSLITYIDDQIGKVIQYLKESGKYENTIVIFTADHGEFAGEHGLVLKNMGIFESVHRIPFILRYPGCPQGHVIDEIIESVDLYPTLCQLAGIEIPGQVDGESFLPVIEQKKPGKSYTVCEWSFLDHYDGMVYAIRNRHFRLVYFVSTQECELYDTRNDPGELNNLYGDPSYRSVQEKLLRILIPYTRPMEFKTTLQTDQVVYERNKYRRSRMIHTECKKWSQVKSIKAIEQMIRSAQDTGSADRPSKTSLSVGK